MKETLKIMGLELSVERKDAKTIKLDAKMGLLFSKSVDLSVEDVTRARDALNKVLG